MTCKEEFISEIINQAWFDITKHPDLRFGQAIFNAAEALYRPIDVARRVQFKHNIDCFYVTDPESPDIQKFLDKCYDVAVELVSRGVSNKEQLTYKGPHMLVPYIPPSLYKEFYIPNIKERGGIPKDKMKEGAWYYCNGKIKAQWVNGNFEYEDSKGEKILGKHFEDAVYPDEILIIPVEYYDGG